MRPMETHDDEWLLEAKPGEIDWFLRGLKEDHRNEYDYTFSTTAHHGQLPPPGVWRTWLIMAGRGFGKTRAGAEWVRRCRPRGADRAGRGDARRGAQRDGRRRKRAARLLSAA